MNRLDISGDLNELLSTTARADGINSFLHFVIGQALGGFRAGVVIRDFLDNSYHSIR